MPPKKKNDGVSKRAIKRTKKALESEELDLALDSYEEEATESKMVVILNRYSL